MQLAIWEIKPDDEGHLVERVIGYDNDDQPIMAEDENILQQIQYIIRIEPTQKDMISTQGTTELDGYQVAHEGDTVTLKLNIPRGYAVAAAYGDVGQQVALLKDANGDYYIVVPRGGGVLLSLKLRRANASTVKVTFDPNGGVVEGHDSAYSISAQLNKEIILPTPDEREGYEFIGWYGADYGKDSEKWAEPAEDDAGILKGGAAFKVEKGIIFTAIWKTK